MGDNDDDDDKDDDEYNANDDCSRPWEAGITMLS